MLLGLLIAIAVLGIGLAQLGVLWSVAAERQRVKELDWAGAQYVLAIKSYRIASAGIVVKTYPPNLQELVADSRFLVPMRHIRKLYVNPFTGRQDWIMLLAPQGGIQGIKVVVKTSGSEKTYQYLADEMAPNAPQNIRANASR